MSNADSFSVVAHWGTLTVMLQSVKGLVLGTPLEARARMLYARFRRYDAGDWPGIHALRLTLRRDSNCVDVGAHSGLFLAEMVRLAPRGRHWAIEPLADLHTRLARCFRSLPNVTVLDCALSDRGGERSFRYVASHPAYSGFEEQDYHGVERVELMRVRTLTLDDVVGECTVAAIKIDVEGAELEVLQGAGHTLRRDRPLVILEHGAAYYQRGTQPLGVFNLLASCGLSLSTACDWPQPHSAASFLAAQSAGVYNWIAAAS